MSITQVFGTQTIEGFPSRNQFCFGNAGPNVMFNAIQVEDGDHARAICFARGVCLFAVGAQTRQSCRNQTKTTSLKPTRGQVLRQEDDFFFKFPISEGRGHSQAQELAFRNKTRHTQYFRPARTQWKHKTRRGSRGAVPDKDAQPAPFPAPAAIANGDDPSHPCKLG